MLDQDNSRLARLQAAMERLAAGGGRRRRRANPLDYERGRPEEDMYMAPDASSIRRSRRVAPRTAVCRPALAWFDMAPEERMEAVLLDVTPYGMRLRALDRVADGALLVVQMMRDEEFLYPLSGPIRTQVMYAREVGEGFVDHGLKRVLPKIRKVGEARPSVPQRVASSRANVATRMYSAEDAVGRRGVRRPGRNRG